MDLDRTPSQISSAAAEEIRALNHRTLDAKVFENPSDVAYTADGIIAAIQRLPQSLHQLEAGLNALYVDNRIRLTDRHPDEVTAESLTEAVTTALIGLQDARTALGAVEEHLRSATRVLGNLGAPWPEGDDED